MKVFSYLLSLEILTIIIIAFFWEEGKSHREIYQIVIDYFQNDNWVISSKYYETSKIISSISTIFMTLNSLYLILWFYLNRKKPTKNYDMTELHKTDFKTIFSALLAGPLVMFFYLNPIRLFPYKTSYYVPYDGITATTVLNIGILITNSFLIPIFILVLFVFIYKIFIYFKSL